MVLRGDLASVDLSQVFQMLALNKKVGLLSIQGERFWQALYFDPRGVTLSHNVHQVVDRLVLAMVRTGKLAEAAVEEIRTHAADTEKDIVDGLLAGGYLDAEELAERYRAELEEQIYELFLRHDAKFEFHEHKKSLPGRDATIDERHFFNCDSVIMEAARRIDEWAFISERVPTQAEVFRCSVDELPADRFREEAAAVFRLLDGYRSVAGVVEASGLVQFQVCKALSQMIDAGVCAAVPPEQLLALADECVRSERLRDAIRLYERAIEQEVGLPDAHGFAASACQAASEFERAVHHFRCEAEQRRRSCRRRRRALRDPRHRPDRPRRARAARGVDLRRGRDGVAGLRRRGGRPRAVRAARRHRGRGPRAGAAGAPRARRAA
jgi:hypothetical protein